MGKQDDASDGDDHSWFREGSRARRPHRAPDSESEVIRILTDTALFPSPVRPVGSRHSMTPCISAEARGPDRRSAGARSSTSTRLIRLRDGTGGPGDHSLKVTPDRDGRSGTVTIPAGRTFISVAQELNAMDPPWAFRVNTELGTLTVGAAACGATKDSSFPGEPGQVCHDVVGMRLVRPDGNVKDYTENDREDLEALRCSYGLFGIVTEVTCRVYPREYMSLRHEELEPEGDRFTSAELKTHFGRWLGHKGNENAVFLYMFPYRDRIVGELRRKPATGDGEAKEKSARLGVRNLFWEKGAHDVEKLARLTGSTRLTHVVQDGFGGLLREYFEHVLHLEKVNPVAQIVDFDKGDTRHRFTFSMWAFLEHKFPEILPQVLRALQEARGGFSQRPAACELSHRPGRELAAVVLPQWRGVDARSDLPRKQDGGREGGMEALPRGIQRVLQRPRGGAAPQPDAAPDTGAGAAGIRGTAREVRGDAAALRSRRSHAQRLFRRFPRG